jgi:hypothetical protein
MIERPHEFGFARSSSPRLSVTAAPLVIAVATKTFSRRRSQSLLHSATMISRRFSLPLLSADSIYILSNPPSRDAEGACIPRLAAIDNHGRCSHQLQPSCSSREGSQSVHDGQESRKPPQMLFAQDRRKPRATSSDASSGLKPSLWPIWQSAFEE